MEASKTAPPPRFLRIPLELRKQIYDYILSDLDGIEGTDREMYRRSWPSGLRDYLSMLLTNQQIHDEIPEALYCRTWTISVTHQDLGFLGVYYRAYKIDHGRAIDEDPSHLKTPFPSTFPFQHIKHLKVRFRGTRYPENRYSELMNITNSSLIWNLLLGNLRLLGNLLKSMTERRTSFGKFSFLFDDEAEFWMEDKFHLDPSELPKVLQSLQDSVRNFESCDLRLIDIANQDFEVMSMARQCGSAIIGTRREDNQGESCSAEDDSNGDLNLVTNSTPEPVIHRDHLSGMVTLHFSRYVQGARTGAGCSCIEREKMRLGGRALICAG